MNAVDDVAVVPLGCGDVEIVKWVLFVAVSWSDDPKVPEMDVVVRHPDVARYHEGWGRRGDLGVKGIANGQLVGAAFARLFTEADHGYGYIDDETPELGIGVDRSIRGRGIGRLLMAALAREARAAGFAQLSLSVNNPNPAKRLYKTLGYTTVHDDGASSVMKLIL